MDRCIDAFGGGVFVRWNSFGVEEVSFFCWNVFLVLFGLLVEQDDFRGGSNIIKEA